MDAAPINLAFACLEPLEANPLGLFAPVSACRQQGKRKAIASPVDVRISVSSHLTDDEPVTQAEIQLVLAYLRDTIADIMGDKA